MSSHRFGLISHEISKALFEMGIWQFECYMVSQPVQALEIFTAMLRESPPLAGSLLLRRSLCVPNLISLQPFVPKISAHLRHCSRFLENRAGDWVRLHCVVGQTFSDGYKVEKRKKPAARKMAKKRPLRNAKRADLSRRKRQAPPREGKGRKVKTDFIAIEIAAAERVSLPKTLSGNQSGLTRFKFLVLAFKFPVPSQKIPCSAEIIPCSVE